MSNYFGSNTSRDSDRELNTAELYIGRMLGPLYFLFLLFIFILFILPFTIMLIFARCLDSNPGSCFPDLYRY
jgi:hypothetical protein